MIALKFEYLEPKTMEEAISLLSRYEDKARVIAGGTDLLIRLKRGEGLHRHLINIKGIPNQDVIVYDEKQGLRIGVLATIHSIELSPLIRQEFGVLAQAASKLGTLQIRNCATIAGNLCNAAPSAEMAPALIVLGATARIIGASGERTVPIDDFFIGPGQTVLKPTEVLTEVQVPSLLSRSGGVYLKQTIRRSLDLAIVEVGVITTIIW
jgi:CO/xanthine dehydrogenase FAD-binding subunit